LAAKRGVTNRARQPPFTVRQILAWADAYHDRTGSWPTVRSGRVGFSTQVTWQIIDSALRTGQRGLPGGQSLAILLRDRRRASRAARK
jgi:hypothetical protein